jgi:hypothetical protein
MTFSLFNRLSLYGYFEAINNLEKGSVKLQITREKGSVTTTKVAWERKIYRGLRAWEKGAVGIVKLVRTAGLEM